MSGQYALLGLAGVAVSTAMLSTGALADPPTPQAPLPLASVPGTESQLGFAMAGSQLIGGLASLTRTEIYRGVVGVGPQTFWTWGPRLPLCRPTLNVASGSGNIRQYAAVGTLVVTCLP